MAIIVKKEEKRNNIAYSCKEILLEHGIKNITISQIAKTAGVGKGTIYEYFKNKEDIVFKIITLYIAEYVKTLEDISIQNTSTKDKIFHFFYTIYEDDKTNKQLNIYREFLAISMTNGTEEMVDFNIKYREKFTDILKQMIKDGVKKGEIREEAQGLVSALFTFDLGLVVETRTAALDPKDEINNFLAALFSLIELRETK